MDIYLDPNHTGKTQLAGRYATAPKAMPTDLTSVYQNGEVLLKWKAPVSASEKPEQYNVYRNNILIGRTFSTSYIDKEPETGIQSYSVSAAIQWLCENHAQAKLLNTKPTENTPNACRLIGAQLFKMLMNLRNDTASGAAQPHTESAPPYGRTY